MNDKTKKLLWILSASILIAAFFLMGGCSNNTEVQAPPNEAPPVSTSTAIEDEIQDEPEDAKVIDSSTQNDSSTKEQKKPEMVIEKKLTCEITITCESLVANPEALPSGKRELIPANGTILATKKMNFKQGESVFDILARATRDNGIHMEFVKTPIYNSAYIEGIHNIYEFDGGEGSGWMYSVNGAFPQKGASTYIIQANDRIHWAYSCDFGKDVGGYSVNQKDE